MFHTYSFFASEKTEMLWEEHSANPHGREADANHCSQILQFRLYLFFVEKHGPSCKLFEWHRAFGSGLRDH